MRRDVADVIAAARRRAKALADRDAAALSDLHHPDLRWTTFRGAVLDRETYVRGNTAGSLVWHAQRLEEPVVVVEGDTAVLTAVAHDIVEQDGVSLAGHAGPRLGVG